MNAAKKSAVAPGQRQLRVAELVRHAIADILARGELREPAIEGLVITIPEVRVSADLRLATAYVMPLGGAGSETVIDALDRNRRFLRGALARRVDLKFTPDLRFRLDRSFAEGERIDALLRSPAVRRDLERRSPGGSNGNDSSQ